MSGVSARRADILEKGKGRWRFLELLSLFPSLPRLARSRGTFHSNPRPPKVFGALAPPTSFRGPFCFASLSAKKIWHTIFFSPQANFKIFPKLLLRRRASHSPACSLKPIFPLAPRDKPKPAV